MYWDVIEVKPEPDGRLALAPLRDEQFFEQVFIDNGAAARPGEIGVAPDAMLGPNRRPTSRGAGGRSGPWQSLNAGRLIPSKFPSIPRAIDVHESISSEAIIREL